MRVGLACRIGSDRFTEQTQVRQLVDNALDLVLFEARGCRQFGRGGISAHQIEEAILSRDRPPARNNDETVVTADQEAGLAPVLGLYARWSVSIQA